MASNDVVDSPVMQLTATPTSKSVSKAAAGSSDPLPVDAADPLPVAAEEGNNYPANVFEVEIDPLPISLEGEDNYAANVSQVEIAKTPTKRGSKRFLSTIDESLAPSVVSPQTSTTKLSMPISIKTESGKSAN